MGACQPSPDCPNFSTGCFEDRHHEFWPKSDYETRVEKVFRSLACNIVSICRAEHEELHATSDPPEKPSQDSMVDAILTADINVPVRLKRELRKGRK